MPHLKAAMRVAAFHKKGLPASSHPRRGELVGRERKARELAGYARETLDPARRIGGGVPSGEWPRVYYGREADGLSADVLTGALLQRVYGSPPWLHR